MVAAEKTRPAVVAPTEVSPKGKRRLYTNEYKRKILEEAAACSEAGQVGALLRREGLYSSHLANWRQARAQGALDTPAKRGPKPRTPDERDQAIAVLEREVRRQKARADRAEAMVALQKKLADVLGQLADEQNEKPR